MSKLIPIQVLRAAAALAVVILHGQYEAGLLVAAGGGGFTPVRLLPWEAGVDVFFVISGFVMVFAARTLFGRTGAATTFLSRRVARVAPLYWLTTTLYLGIALAVPSVVNGSVTPGYVLASYAFFPMARADGAVEPLYSLGWTLNYEMAFYAVFALAVRLPRRRAVLALLACLGGFVGWVQLAGAPLPFRFWGDPIILEFGLGVVLGLLRAEGVVLGAPIRSALGLLGLGLFAIAAGLEPGLHRALLYGIPAACLVAGCGLGREHVASEETRLVRLGAILGDASYALYLIHPFVLRGLRMVVQATGFGSMLGPWGFLALALLVVVAASIVVFLLVERPLNALARNWIATGRPQPA